MTELSISGRTFRQKYQVSSSPIANRVVSVPPLLKGHSITMQFMITGSYDSFYVCFGTSETVRTSPGIVATIGKSEGSIVHMKPVISCTQSVPSRVSLPQNVNPRVVASYKKDTSAVCFFWMVWREGLLFVGCGNVGEGLLMAADVSSDELSVGLDPKPDKGASSRYVTDDVAAIYIGLVNSTNQVLYTSNWDVVVRALWRNSACRYARALTSCDSSLPEASPKERVTRDKTLGRRSVNLYVHRLPGNISLAELAWWLRFAYRPRSGPLARKINSAPPEEQVGHNIDVESVRLVENSLCSNGDRKVQLQLRVTKEVLRAILSAPHVIKDLENHVWITQE